MSESELKGIPFKLTIEKDEFERIRLNPKFVDFLQLARFANSLAFLSQAFSDYAADISPVGIRQVLRSTIFRVGVLHEGLHLVDGLQEVYRPKEYFKEGFGKWTSDRRIKNFRSRFIHNVRNQMAFHCDPDVIRNTLSKNFELDEYVLISGNSEVGLNLFFELSETIEQDFLVKDHGTNEEKLIATDTFLNTLGEVSIMFVKSTDTFLTGILKELEVNLTKVNGKILTTID